MSLPLLRLASASSGQTGGSVTLCGDFKVDEREAGGLAPFSFDLILYGSSSVRVVVGGAFRIPGRYSFREAPNGEYAMWSRWRHTRWPASHVLLIEPSKTDVRQDISLEWRSKFHSNAKPGIVSAGEYARKSPYKSGYEKPLVSPIVGSIFYLSSGPVLKD